MAPTTAAVNGIAIGSTFKPQPITLGSIIKLTGNSHFRNWKSQIIATAKVGGWIEYIQTPSEVHWVSMCNRYNTFSSHALYYLYRENHYKISGYLQLCVNDVIPNWDEFTSEIMSDPELHQMGYGSSNGMSDVQIGGMFIDDNTHHIWNALNKHYNSENVNDSLVIINQLLQLHYNGSTDVSIYVTDITSLWGKLNRSLAHKKIMPGMVLPDELLAVNMLRHMPVKTRDHLITLLTATRTGLTSAAVREKIQALYRQAHPLGVTLVKQSNTTTSVNTNSDGSNVKDAANYGDSEPSKGKGWNKSKYKKKSQQNNNGTSANSSRRDDNDTVSEAGTDSKQNGPYGNQPQLNNSNGENSTEFGWSAVDNAELALSYDGNSIDPNIHEDSIAKCDDVSISDKELDDESDEVVLAAKENTTKLNPSYAAKSGNPANYRDDHTSMWTFTIDSGCTRHIVCNQKLFIPGTMKKPQYRFNIASLSGQQLNVALVGNVRLNARITLYDVWYLPQAKSNLISTRLVADAGFALVTDKNATTVNRNGKEIFRFFRHGSLYQWTHPSGRNVNGSATPGFSYNPYSKSNAAAGSTANGNERKQSGDKLNQSWKVIPKKTGQTESSADQSGLPQQPSANLQQQRKQRPRKLNEDKAQAAYFAIEEHNSTGAMGSDNATKPHYNVNHTTDGIIDIESGGANIYYNDD